MCRAAAAFSIRASILPTSSLTLSENLMESYDDRSRCRASTTLWLPVSASVVALTVLPLLSERMARITRFAKRRKRRLAHSRPRSWLEMMYLAPEQSRCWGRWGGQPASNSVKDIPFRIMDCSWWAILLRWWPREPMGFASHLVKTGSARQNICERGTTTQRNPAQLLSPDTSGKLTF